MTPTSLFARRHPCGAAPTLFALVACAALCQAAQAQQAAEPQAELPTVTVTATPERSGQASITGLGDTPGWQLPMQAQRYSSTALANSGAQRLSDLTSLDASTSDSYNAQGYWDFLSVRGFTLDNAYNYRREGLPINAETSIPLDNKDAVELLKGTSGMQAGVSAPGGLVNFLVKRPVAKLRSATLAFTGGSSFLTAVDLSDRFGESQALGWRFNAAHEHLDPNARHAQGNRQLLALAADWRLRPGTLLEFEIEHSHRSQPSVTAFSITGNTVPSAKAIDPDTNLNYQPWSSPVVMDATTGSLRWKQLLAPGWTLVSTVGSQRLVSQDHTVFAFGCTRPSPAPYLADRFCPNGDYDASDFRSDNEVRVTNAADLALQGSLTTAGVKHDLRAGLQRSVHRTSLQQSAYNPIGTGNIYDDTIAFSPAPATDFPQGSRHSRNTEVSLSDQLTLSPAWTAWLGARHTQLHRNTSLSDGSPGSPSIDQTFTTPWAALGYAFAGKHQAYLSWGEGVESKDVPFFYYANSGDPLPAQKSRQVELGVKGQESQSQWSVNLFQITRPQTGLDAGNYMVLDGQARHRGLEGQWQTQMGAWNVDAGAMLIDAERRGATLNTSFNGKEPVNVPKHTLKASVTYKVLAVTGLTLHGNVVHEGRRMVLEDNSLSIPAWTRFDAGLRFTQPVRQASLTWRLGVYNLFDKRAWRESPMQFSHVYLFPMAGRTVTASLQADF